MCALGDEARPGGPPDKDRLRKDLLAGGLEDVVVVPVPDTRGDRLIIRGLASAESREAARDLVVGQIYDATLDLIILEPGVWVDEGVRGLESD
jgi:predicted small integral membrane protein